MLWAVPPFKQGRKSVRDGQKAEVCGLLYLLFFFFKTKFVSKEFASAGLHDVLRLNSVVTTRPT